MNALDSGVRATGQGPVLREPYCFPQNNRFLVFTMLYEGVENTVGNAQFLRLHKEVDGVKSHPRCHVPPQTPRSLNASTPSHNSHNANNAQSHYHTCL